MKIDPPELKHLPDNIKRDHCFYLTSDLKYVDLLTNSYMLYDDMQSNYFVCKDCGTKLQTNEGFAFRYVLGEGYIYVGRLTEGIIPSHDEILIETIIK